MARASTAAVAAYEAELRAAGPPVAESGVPAFDVVLLGIGPDGHVLSVFPGSPLLDDTEAWVAAVPAPTHVEPHVPRLSLHAPDPRRRRGSVVVVVHGAGKAAILASVLGAGAGRATLAGAARPARERDLVPRSRGGGRAPRPARLSPPHRPERLRMLPGPFSPDHAIAESRDGTPIAFFEVLPAEVPPADPTRPGAARPPVLLVHGAAADHTTWRAVGPAPRAAAGRVFAMDRRGRGASGDAATGAYSIEREYEDVAAAAEAIAAASRTPGRRRGRATRTAAARPSARASSRAAIRRVVVYEGAPVPPGMSYRPPGLVEAVRAALERGDNEGALATFLQGIVGLSDEALDAYRREPVWPARVAAAPTILREIEAEASPAASIEALGRATVPVLLLLGSISRSPFRIGTDALAERLADAQVAVIEGAAHAAHHTHVEEFVALVEKFLDR